MHKTKTKNILYLIAGFIFTFGSAIISVFLMGFILLHIKPIVRSDSFLLRTSKGMIESDIVAMFGKPYSILYKSDYEEILNSVKKEKKKLEMPDGKVYYWDNMIGSKMPVTNKVYVYEVNLFPLSDYFYVYFDEKNIVNCTYLASGDFYPFYQRRYIHKYRKKNLKKWRKTDELEQSE